MVYIPDEFALAQFKGWTGPIGQDLIRRGRTLEFRAKMSVGHDTGRLAASIETRRRTVVDGLQLEIGSWTVDYAAAQHEGARPHVILPKYAPFLVFRVGGRLVFAKKVNHPGNHANPYLARWLKEAVA